MRIILGILCVFLNIIAINGLIIPDELPSILSVIYSNIPTLKKGTDSRIGWGFRLGDRADFQVLVELGPQTNTQPLANQGEEGTNKRHTLNNLANTLYAQRQREKFEELQKVKDIPLGTQTEEWLTKWSKTMTGKNTYQENQKHLVPKPGIAIGEIDAKSVIPDDTIMEEMEKHKPKLSNIKREKSGNKVNLKININTTPQSLVDILTKGDETD